MPKGSAPPEKTEVRAFFAGSVKLLNLRLEKLTGKLQLFLMGKSFVKFLGGGFINEISLRSGVFARYSVKVSGNQLPANEERRVCALR